MDGIAQNSAAMCVHQRVENGKKRSKGLPGAGGGGDQDVVPGTNQRPCLALGGSRFAVTLPEPLENRGSDFGHERANSSLRGRRQLRRASRRCPAGWCTFVLLIPC